MCLLGGRWKGGTLAKKIMLRNAKVSFQQSCPMHELKQKEKYR